MSIGERTERGFEARLRPRGAGRFLGAAFLLFWLCGWLAGESVALWFLVRGAFALLTGQPPEPGRDPLQLAPAIAVGAFLVVWLSFWTLGGVLAIIHLLQLLWAEDRLVAGAGELSIEHRLGPFRSRHVIAQGDLRDIRLSRTGHLVAETAKSSIELTRLGTPAERQELAPVLRRETGVDQRVDDSGRAELPDGWQEIITPEGGPALVAELATRAIRARVAAIVAFAALAGTALLAREAVRNPALLTQCLISAAVSFGLAWGAVWLARGRVEWRIESGRIVLQRRFGPRVNETFRAVRLELSVTRDSDGDEWFELAALADMEAPAMAGEAAIGTPRVQRRRSILRAMNDDAGPRRLGAWLSRRAGLPFDDRATGSARPADLAALKVQLASSGRLGEMASRFIDRLEKRQAR